MPRQSFTLKVRPPFEFELIVRSHGWYALPPFSWNCDDGCLLYSFALDERRAVTVELRQASTGVAGVLMSDAPLSPADVRWSKSAVRSMLRVDDDLSEFYALIEGDPRLGWAAARGGGRILRCATAFEDLIKIVCTTNCTWSLTTAMVTNLVDHAGLRAPGDRRAFPTAAASARRRLPFFRDKAKTGYRAPYLVELCRQVARGELSPDDWRDPARECADLRKQLLALPGVGPYAAAHLLRMSGHYQDHGIDSWCRKRFGNIHGEARASSDRAIADHYARFGRWAGLALWLDLTAEWHT